jgi:hypothetical protein
MRRSRFPRRCDRADQISCDLAQPVAQILRETLVNKNRSRIFSSLKDGLAEFDLQSKKTNARLPAIDF